MSLLTKDREAALREYFDHEADELFAEIAYLRSALKQSEENMDRHLNAIVTADRENAVLRAQRDELLKAALAFLNEPVLTTKDHLRELVMSHVRAKHLLQVIESEEKP